MCRACKTKTIVQRFIVGSMPQSSSPQEPSGKDRSSSSVGRWIALALAVLFFGIVMQEVLFPFAGQPYQEIPHGDHTHYRPKDYNPNVPISAFPTQPPGPDERITPDGDVVPKE